jgi:hypothetical protein
MQLKHESYGMPGTALRSSSVPMTGVCPCPPVQVVQADEHLAREVAHDGDGDPPVVIVLDQAQ